MSRPAVVFKLRFFNPSHPAWQIGSGDYLDYMDRPEKFTSLQQNKDYLDYMGDNEKSIGNFDATKDCLNEIDKEKFRQLEIQSKAQGCPKYIAVMSFDNAFLEKNGLIVNNRLDDRQMRKIARLAISELIDKSKKLDNDNVYWVASIHKNTDNIHVHYTFLEKEMRCDRVKKYRDGNSIELKAINALKSKVFNTISIDVRRSKHFDELKRLQRELLLPTLSTQFSNTAVNIFGLAKQLPPDKRWQYNRPKMKPYRKAIDECVTSVIQSTPELQKMWIDYIAELDSMTEYYKEVYGQGEKSQYAQYKHNQLKDFYARAGNSLLQYIADADFGNKDEVAAISDISSETDDYDFILYSESNYIQEWLNKNKNDSQETEAHLSEYKMQQAQGSVMGQLESYLLKNDKYFKLTDKQRNNIAKEMLERKVIGKKHYLKSRLNSAASDLRKAEYCADNVYRQMMAHLRELQREFDYENNVIDDLTYVY